MGKSPPLASALDKIHMMSRRIAKTATRWKSRIAKTTTRWKSRRTGKRVLRYVFIYAVSSNT